MRVDHLTKTYGEKTLFKDLSFLIHEEDRIGLIGINGTGKTSLLNILAGFDQGDAGEVVAPQDYTIGYLSQDKEFDPELTVLDAVFMGESPLLKTVRQYEKALVDLEKDGNNASYQKNYAKAEEAMNQEDAWLADTNGKIILQKLGIPMISEKCGKLSGGQKKRVALAQVLIQAPDLLILDEPTNHLDYKAITWLETYLKQYKGALLMVTHDRYFLDHVTNRIFELAFGKLHEYRGNYQKYLEEKAVREADAIVAEGKRKQLYKQELAWMRAGVQARGTKQQARINRFEDLKENLYQVKTNDSLELDIATQRLGKKVLEIRQGNYQIADKVILRDFDLLIQARERLGITGENGAGKSTLLNILAGRLPLDSGLYEIGETVQLAYYTQQNEALDPGKRMIQYLQEVAEEVRRQDGSTIGVPEMLERFLFPRSSHGTLIGKLSGGEKRRLFLLKLLIAQPNVLLLDEPTNDLDTATLTVLEDYIAQFKGAVIAVSHDRYFLDKTMEKLLIFQGAGQITSYFGSMTGYLAQVAENNEPKEKTPPKIPEPTPASSAPVAKKKLTYSEQKEWATIEEDIAKLEELADRLSQEMETQGADFTRLQALQKELAETETLLEEKMNRWEYLSEFTSD